MTFKGLVETFEADFEDMCTAKNLAGVDGGERTTIGPNGITNGISRMLQNSLEINHDFLPKSKVRGGGR
jgi:hypothetical protein